MSTIDRILFVCGGVFGACLGIRVARRQPLTAGALALLGLILVERGSAGSAAGERMFDKVQEASEESFPASDAPAWI